MSESSRSKPSFIDRGSGATLVFVHGFPLSRGAWQRQVEALAGRYRVVVPDLPGFGGREPLQGVATMERYADDVAALVARLDAGPVVLVGHSMGGYVALAFVHRHRSLLEGLVLVGTRPGADDASAAEGRRKTAAKVREEGIDGVVDAMTSKMLAPGNRADASLAAVREMMVSASVEGVAGALLGMAERRDATADLPSIDLPTLVVTGEEDEVISPEESVSLAAALPHAHLRKIPGAGHLVAWEQPDAFDRELLAWLETHRTEA